MSNGVKVFLKKVSWLREKRKFLAKYQGLKRNAFRG